MRTFTRRVLLFEAVGFGASLCLLWLNEVLDLPHHVLHAPATPINWRESVAESVAVTALAIGTMWWTYRAVARIRYLEGLLRVCMFCKRIDAGGEWVPIVDFVTDHSEAVFSHGLCPECRERHYPPLEQRAESSRSQ